MRTESLNRGFYPDDIKFPLLFISVSDISISDIDISYRLSFESEI